MQTKIFRGVETTTATDENDTLSGIYRGTTVCKKLQPSGKVILNSGGWRTSTTKNRMNQFSQNFCSGRFAVVQRDHEWYVVYHHDQSNLIPFVDNMEV